MTNQNKLILRFFYCFFVTKLFSYHVTCNHSIMLMMKYLNSYIVKAVMARFDHQKCVSLGSENDVFVSLNNQND